MRVKKVIRTLSTQTTYISSHTSEKTSDFLLRLSFKSLYHHFWADLGHKYPANMSLNKLSETCWTGIGLCVLIRFESIGVNKLFEP